MKDPFSLSDTDEDKAVEDLLSQANDLAVLDQIAVINCSGFTESALPSDLESRFHRLKTFPNSSSSTTTTKPPNHPKPKPSSLPHSLSAPHPNPNSNRHQPQPQPRKPTSLRFESSDAASLTGSALRPKSLRRRSLSTASDSSPSPPRRSGCLWVFSRRKKEGKGKRKDGGAELGGWDKTEELLEDLGSFSVKEQRRILKAAVEEQRKMKEEARKIVKMAKQASARMNISDIEDDDGSLESL